VKEPPGQSGTNRQCRSGIGSNSLPQLRQHALRTVFGSFFGLLDASAAIDLSISSGLIVGVFI
jgi:hypothetical protein